MINSSLFKDAYLFSINHTKYKIDIKYLITNEFIILYYHNKFHAYRVIEYSGSCRDCDIFKYLNNYCYIHINNERDTVMCLSSLKSKCDIQSHKAFKRLIPSSNKLNLFIVSKIRIYLNNLSHEM